MVEQKDLVQLLANRRVYNRQYGHNATQLVRHYSLDKFLLFLLAVIAAALVYQVLKDFKMPLVPLLVLAGAFAGWGAFIYKIAEERLLRITPK